MEKEKKLEITKLRERVYLFDENHQATGYLVIGDNKAVMIDTMCGEYNLMEYIRKITDKPVEVINTHFHMDHTAGNVFFDKAYIHPVDKPLAEKFYAQEEVKAELKARNYRIPEFSETREGDVFDLGSLTLKIYDLPGHTPGGIVVLCPEERILFTGDGINHFLWMQLDCCLSLKDFIPELERLTFLTEEADYIAHGHARGLDDISLLTSLLEGVKEIVAGKTGEDTDYEWYGNVDRMHPFKVDPTKEFDMQVNFVCYKADHIV